MPAEEREAFKHNIQPLYKIKRAILETTSITPDQIVVKKNTKQVFITDGPNLKLLATMVSRRNITWEPDVIDAIRENTTFLSIRDSADQVKLLPCFLGIDAVRLMSILLRIYQRNLT